MKAIITKFLFAIIVITLSVSAMAQSNRTNEKKSVAYKAGYQRVASGSMGYHTLEIREGALWGWGFNEYGTIGDGTDIGKTSPVRVGTDNNWVSVAAGNIHSLGLKSNGTVWAWGDNSFGQLGNGTQTGELSPVQMGTADNWISIAAGVSHSLGLKSDGTLWAWGDNFYGQLGDGTLLEQDDPVQIGTDHNWISISAGGLHSFAIKSDGTLWAWGYNDEGELGDGTTNSQDSPIQIGTDHNWVSVSGGMYNSLGLKSDGSIWGWGYNSDGAIGDGTGLPQYNPVQIGTDHNWTAVVTAQFHSLGLKSDGTLWAWGYNADGELGDGTTISRFSPVRIGTDNHWVTIAVSALNSFGTKSDGKLFAWGYNSEGQLGDGTTVLKTSPIQTSASLKGWLKLSGGSNHSIGLKLDGKLWSWGDNSFGQLGDGTNIQRNGPVQVGVQNDWISTVAGATHNIGLKSNGTLWAWGNNTSGQLGDGTISGRSTPLQIGSDQDWVSIAAGESHSLGLKADGTVWAWGNNTYGQLGNGSFINSNSPVQVGTDHDWTSISAGKEHCLALKSNGTLWAWGRNNLSQLGDGSNVARNSPVQIGLLNEWMGICGGGTHSLAIKTSGTLWSWGANNYGQLGDGTNIGKNSPFQIGSDTKWINITANSSHSIALNANGNALSWGNNINGELGIGTYSSQQTSPVLISGNDWINLAAGAEHSLAIKSDRNSFCATGKNTTGQLGNGNLNNSNEFVCTSNCNISGSGTTSPVTCYGMSNGSANITLTGADASFPGTYTVDMGTSQSYTSNPFSITGLTAGSHQVIVITVGGCFTSPITVNVGNAPQVTGTATTTPVSCAGNTSGTATITLSGAASSAPGTFNVDAGATQAYTTNPFTVTGLTPGNHTIVATVTGGCVSSDILLNVGATATFTASYVKTDLSSCGNSQNGTITVTPTGGTAPYTYSWSGITGSGNPASTVFTAGNVSALTGLNYGYYNVTITDAGGCGELRINNIHVEIGYPVSVTFNSSISASCSNTGSVILYGSSGIKPYTYSLTSASGPFQNENTFTGLAAGTYTGYIRDAGGCVSERTGINILSASPLNVQAYARSASSCSNDGAIEIYRSGGIPPYMYSLDGTNYQGSNVFSALAAGSYTAYVKDSKSCVAQQIVSVTAGAAISIIASKTNSSNCVNDGAIQANAVGGTAPYTYRLNGGTYQSSGSFNSLAPGNYLITVKDTKGCTGSINIEISIAQILVTAYASPASNCFTNNGKIQMFRTGGFGPYTYSLDASTYQASNVFNNLAAGAYNGFVKDSKGCVGLLQDILVGPNCVSSFTKTPTDFRSNSVATKGHDIQFNCTVSPNPAVSEFTLMLDRYDANEMVSINVTDILGRKIFKNNAIAGNRYKFGKEFIPGIYLLEVINGKNKQSIKIVKQ